MVAPHLASLTTPLSFMVFAAGAFSAFLVESFANADMLHMSTKAKIAVINFFIVHLLGRRTAKIEFRWP
jgi:hypothetical protein